jgi:spermidine synthase
VSAFRKLRRALRNSRSPELVVSERGGVRALHIGGVAVQSAMRLDDPYALALDYTRCMMAFLLFHPEPREALMIGLGGGSLAKFLHRELRTLRVRIVEIDARVIDAARAHFHLPPNDARLAVELGCGAEALAPECCDLLVVDGFVDEVLPESLASTAFFDAAWMGLAEPGVLVMNLMDSDPQFDQTLQHLERSFGGAVLCMPALVDPNVIVLALKGSPARVEWQGLRQRAAALEARFGLPFQRYVNALREMNPHSAEELIVAPAGDAAQ